jgi:hypothetical protein
MFSIVELEKMPRDAKKKSEIAAQARAKLPPGSSRARITTANARWMRAAEHRDRLERQLREVREAAMA